MGRLRPADVQWEKGNKKLVKGSGTGCSHLQQYNENFRDLNVMAMRSSSTGCNVSRLGWGKLTLLRFANDTLIERPSILRNRTRNPSTINEPTITIKTISILRSTITTATAVQGREQ